MFKGGAEEQIKNPPPPCQGYVWGIENKEKRKKRSDLFTQSIKYLLGIEGIFMRLTNVKSVFWFKS